MQSLYHIHLSYYRKEFLEDGFKVGAKDILNLGSYRHHEVLRTIKQTIW